MRLHHQGRLTISALLKRPIAFLPLTMSLLAVLTIVVHIAVAGTAPEADEGVAAHIWQLLMAFQVPFIALFAIKWLPQAPRPAALVLGFQVVAIAAALAPVALLKW